MRTAMIRRLKVAPELVVQLLTTGSTTHGTLLIEEGIPGHAVLVDARMEPVVGAPDVMELVLYFDLGGDPMRGPDMTVKIRRFNEPGLEPHLAPRKEASQ